MKVDREIERDSGCGRVARAWPEGFVKVALGMAIWWGWGWGGEMGAAVSRERC